MKVVCALTLLGLFAFGEPVSAHDVPFSAEDTARIEKFFGVAAKSSPPDGRLTASSIRAAAAALAGVTGGAVKDIDHFPAWEKLSEPVRSHAVALIAGVRVAGLGKGLRAGGEEIAALVVSSDSRAPGELLLALARDARSPVMEKFVINALAPDSRPEIRVIAGRIAKILNLLQPTTQGLVTLANSLLGDKDPTVAFLFAGHDAYDFRSLGVVERMVAQMKDERRRPRREGGVLRGPDSTVGAAIRAQLAGHWIGSAEGESSRPAGEDTESLKTWWTEHKTSWPQVAMTSWELAFEGTLDLKLKQPVPLAVTGRAEPHTVALELYEESWEADLPLLSTQVIVRGGGQLVANASNNNHDIGFVMDGRTGAGKPRARIRAVVLPISGESSVTWLQLFYPAR